jgi:hypothetical protein
VIDHDVYGRNLQGMSLGPAAQRPNRRTDAIRELLGQTKYLSELFGGYFVCHTSFVTHRLCNERGHPQGWPLCLLRSSLLSGAGVLLESGL